jgi:hypothetical protein
VTFTYENGTDHEIAWFKDAVRACLFPFERITTTVHVSWADEIPLGHNFFAYTHWNTTPTDACGRPDVASIQIRHDLDDPSARKPKGYFHGKAFYMETVVHELAHVVQSKFDPGHIAAMSAVFFGGPDDWSGDETGALWAVRRQEAYAETFKDLWLPRPNRRFDNRTNYKLTPDRLESFVHVLDDVCPCTASALIADDGGGGIILT